MIESKASQPMPERQKCPQCGNPLPAGTLAGLCPVCLLKQGTQRDTATQPEAPPFAPPSVPEIAKLFPQLEILSLLGKGGMGAVYQARQPALDRLVALKVLPAQGDADPGFAEVFWRVARAMARLSHPNIVAVHEFGQAGNLHYFIMEFVDGVNLRQLEQAGRLSAREALQIVPQLCDALQYAHDAGVVHRDIKPENVMVDRKGRVKIADFGLAKILGHEAETWRLTGAGHVMGTPHYMSPEQLERPQEVDHRADIYSLGVVFYEMLTGELPLGRFGPPSSKVQIDVRLDDVVLRALEKEPGRRYQQISEVKTRMESIAQTPGALPPPQLIPTRNRIASWKMAIAVAVAAILLAFPIASLLEVFRDLQHTRVATETAQTVKDAEQAALQAKARAWRPIVVPGEKIDGTKVLNEAKSLTDQGQYEEALLRYLWCYDHALEYNLASSGIRLLSSYSDWIELGRRYPKARQALIDIRDRNSRDLAEGKGYFALFMEVQNMSQYLQDNDATVALFKKIRAKDPALADKCFISAKGLLADKGEYALFMGYQPDPEAGFAGIRQQWEMMKGFEDTAGKRNEELQKTLDENDAKLLRENPGMKLPRRNRTPFPAPPKTADNNFIGQTRQLIEVLAGVGRKSEAEKIQGEAVAVLDDERLKSAVRDAEKKVGK